MPDSSDDSFFRNICLNAGVALIATDNHLRITFWNPAAGRLFGGSSESMIGESILTVIPAVRRDLAQRFFDRAVHRAEVSAFEFQHRDPAGRPVQLAVTVSPIVDDQGVGNGASVYVRDVTRRVALERDMADGRKMSALGAMAGAVAHHFNNFFGGIITSIDFARSSDDPAVLRRALEATSSALSRASQMTLRLLAFAEGDRTTTSSDDLADTVSRFAQQARPLLEVEGILLELDVQPIHVAAPSKRIWTILESLTANACEAMRTGGTLRIELITAPGQDETILLRIGDSGAGMTADCMSRAFEPFFTTKAADPDDPSEHAGLGLAVVHGIVRDLGGSATLCSAEQGGTICAVRLPRDMVKG